MESTYKKVRWKLSAFEDEETEVQKWEVTYGGHSALLTEPRSKASSVQQQTPFVKWVYVIRVGVSKILVVPE
jgi:hypothetical protein